MIIKKSELKFNPQEICNKLIELYANYLITTYDGLTTASKLNDYEIIINKNDQIPCPGLFQANHIVTILNKDKGI